MARFDPNPVPSVSPFLWRWFTWYSRRFLRKHMHAVRVLRGGEPPAVQPADPIIICCNHPSWWDPMVGIFLASHLWPDRTHYWPIDAAMLAKYRFFARLGFFGVEKDTRGGAATFLRTATAALSRPQACLWVTAGGEFADVRARPVQIKGGIAHLARWLGRGVILPLAVEYPFWTERTPEVLLAFGRPILASATPQVADLAAALTNAMDGLAAAVTTRDPGRFSTLLGGSVGTSGVYDAWRRGKSFVAGRRFDAAHASDPGSEASAA